MKFNDLASSSGLCQDADFWVGTDQIKYPLRHKARNATEWVRKVATWIWQADSDWHFDDTNFATLPEATTDLDDGIQDISLPTEVFKVERMEVVDIGGIGRLVKPIDKTMVTDEALSEFEKEPGLPEWYDLEGSQIKLYPAPSSSNVTLTGGLVLYLSRDIDPFVAGDTTKEPGVMPYFHRIVSKGMALDYAISKGASFKDKASALKRDIYGDPNVPNDGGLKGELLQAYGSRHPDFKRKFRVKVDNRL